MVRLPFTPSFASGCTASSRIWNSQPIDDPAPLLSVVSTKYLMPLFAPVVMLYSTMSSKFAYWPTVTMSPKATASPPPVSTTVSAPSLISQPFSGNPVSFAPRQPAVVLPSHSSVQPSFASRAESAFGMWFSCGVSPLSGVRFASRFAVMIRRLRKRMTFPALDASDPMECTCSASTPLGVRSSRMFATGTPFTQVRIELPMASTRNVFHAFILKAFLAASLPSFVYSHPRRASS